MPRTSPVWPLPAAVFAPVLLLAACADGSTEAPSVQAAATQPTTLYERLGGRPGLTAVMNEFMSNVAADYRINKYFRRANTATFRAQLIDQICAATGGPCVYTGRSMEEVHMGMGVTETAFNALLENLALSMTRFGVPAQDQAALLAVLAPMRSDIVSAPVARRPGPDRAAPARTSSAKPPAARPAPGTAKTAPATRGGARTSA